MFSNWIFSLSIFFFSSARSQPSTGSLTSYSSFKAGALTGAGGSAAGLKRAATSGAVAAVDPKKIKVSNELVQLESYFYSTLQGDMQVKHFTRWGGKKRRVLIGSFWYFLFSAVGLNRWVQSRHGVQVSPLQEAIHEQRGIHEAPQLARGKRSRLCHRPGRPLPVQVLFQGE